MKRSAWNNVSHYVRKRRGSATKRAATDGRLDGVGRTSVG